ncbi:MAG: class I SAM-dependent methyltransferase [Desulfuromonadales bacterium]|jgi:23S rRNA (cytosine1962-C5)-methyltransferase|nr:class I SAM-dependent methyltransferase [Desulfuromonadales bacterium]
MQIIHDEILRHLPHANETRRLFHGRGQCFAGYDDLVIDYFPPVAMVILYRPRPQAWLEDLTRLLDRVLPHKPQTVLLQERFLPNGPSRTLQGTLPAGLDAQEAGLSFRLRLGEAQNIGFFPDMAVGRRLVRQRTAGKRMLNLFAYSCSFSVAALAGGATQVVNLDMNRGALELGKLNHRINGVDLRQASFLPLEFFRSLSKLRKLGPFDLVVCDPPASQGKSFTAERHWPKLVRSLPGLVSPGGEVLACLNAPDLGPDYLDGLFAAHIPAAEKLGLFTPGEDFPEARAECGVTLHLYRLP